MSGVASSCRLPIVSGIGEGISCTAVELSASWIDVNGCVGGFVSPFSRKIRVDVLCTAVPGVGRGGGARNDLDEKSGGMADFSVVINRFSSRRFHAR